MNELKKSGFALENFKVSDDVNSAAKVAMKKSFQLLNDPHGLDKLTRNDRTRNEAIATLSAFEKQNALLGFSASDIALKKMMDEVAGLTSLHDSLKSAFPQHLSDILNAEKRMTSLLGIADTSHFDSLFGINTFERKFSQYEIRREQELQRLLSGGYPQTVGEYAFKQDHDLLRHYNDLLKPIQEQAEFQAEFLGLALCEAAEQGNDAEIQSILETPNFGKETIKAMYRAGNISHEDRQKIKNDAEKFNSDITVLKTEIAELIKKIEEKNLRLEKYGGRKEGAIAAHTKFVFEVLKNNIDGANRELWKQLKNAIDSYESTDCPLWLDDDVIRFSGKDDEYTFSAFQKTMVKLRKK